MIEAHFPVITGVETIKVSSIAFKHNGFIPAKYTCDGTNISPPLTIGELPERTKSLVIVVEDPDAPIRSWVHWIVWNVLPTHTIQEASIPGIEGRNDFQQNHYGGPCPPSGTHHYYFKIYALDDVLSINKGAARHEVEKAMNSHIIAKGELVGLYKKAR